MRSFIFSIVDYLINSIETKCVNIDVVSIASNMIATNCGSYGNNTSSINGVDAKSSQLCRRSNGSGWWEKS